MKKLYLITGATGHLGTVLLEKLLSRKKEIRVFSLASEKGALEGKNIEVFVGDVRDKDSMREFFERSDYDFVSLIHAAAYITIGSKHNPLVWDVNVKGTINVMELALENGIDRVVYVSSVHALPEKEHGQIIEEVLEFNEGAVLGQYAKSKAVAAQRVLEFAEKGLNVSIVHPSGMIGHGDLQFKNHSVRTIQSMQSGGIFMSIEGGYDFVDSRDVVEGILACEEKGRPGQCYILSGHFISINDLINRVRNLGGKGPVAINIPYCIIKAFAPISEWIANLFGSPSPVFTPYSVAVLQSNSRFSHEKATRELGYQPRPLNETIKATLKYR